MPYNLRIEIKKPFWDILLIISFEQFYIVDFFNSLGIAQGGFTQINRIDDMNPFKGQIVAVRTNPYFAAEPHLNTPEFRLKDLPFGFLYVPHMITNDYQGGPGYACGQFVQKFKASLPVVVNQETLSKYQGFFVRKATEAELAKIQSVVSEKLAHFSGKFCPGAREASIEILKQR